MVIESTAKVIDLLVRYHRWLDNSVWCGPEEGRIEAHLEGLQTKNLKGEVVDTPEGKCVQFEWNNWTVKVLNGEIWAEKKDMKVSCPPG